MKDVKLLNQAVAVKKGISSRVTEANKNLHKVLDKPELFDGHSKKFVPINAEGEVFPDDNKKVQFVASQVIKDIAKGLVELFDIEATVDETNSLARADVVVDGQVVVTGVPATTLIFLEKQLELFRSDLHKAPELNPNYNWDKDVNSQLFKTDNEQTHKTKKVQKALVLLEPTKEHPGNAVLVTEDVTIGYWNSVKMSGALPAPDKTSLLEKTNKLMDAVKVAREQANTQEVKELKVGSAIFGYLLS